MKALALSFLLLMVAAPAAELDPNTHEHIHYCYLNGMRYVFAISDARYATMRSWNPNQDAHPPVTPKRALQLAEKRLAKIEIPKNYGWRLERVSLEPVNGLSPDGKWMYVVSFRYFVNGPSSGISPTMDFVVTMDDELVC